MVTMKKIITLVLVSTILIGCSTDDECTCRGRYQLVNVENSGIFFADNVDCDTGERPSSPIQSNALFIGCD